MADGVKWCHVCETAGDEEHLKELERVLPPGYQHLVCVFKAEEQRVVLKVKLSSREQVENWLKDFQLSSSVTWRKARTYPESGRYNTYRVDFRCQHNTYGPRKITKNTNCRATLFLVLKRSMKDRRSRCTDRHMVDGYLLYVNWRNNHNHVIVCRALGKRHASAATRQVQEADTNLAVPRPPGTTWHVDAVLSRCPCPVGVPGARCKHQVAVLQAFDVTEAAPAGRTPELRKLYYEVEHSVDDVDEDGDCAGTSPTSISGDPQGQDALEAPRSSSVGASTSTECPKRRLEHFVDSLKRKLDTDDSFTAPVNAFVDTFDKLQTDSALQSSLVSFGKPHMADAKLPATPRGLLQASTAIGVQATTVAWRKTNPGGGRTTVAGRPPKSSRKEHGYCKQGGEKPAAPLNPGKTH